MARAPKSPQQKKRLSRAKDRRNTYGENDKASRKNIPRSKAKDHRAVRRTARAAAEMVTRLAEADADAVQSTLATPRLQKGKWRKCADTPLGKVIARKLNRRLRAVSRRPKSGEA